MLDLALGLLTLLAMGLAAYGAAALMDRHAPCDDCGLGPSRCACGANLEAPDRGVGMYPDD